MTQLIEGRAISQRAVSVPRLGLYAGVALTILVACAGLATGAGVLRLAYLCVAVGCASLWIERRPGETLAFAAWLFMFTPLARRMIDVSAGYAEPNLTMLAPYLVLLMMAPRAVAYVLTGRKHAAAMAAMGLAIAWGLAVGLARGQPLGAMFDALKWFAPLFLLGYVLSMGLARDELARLLRDLAIFAILAAVYAFVQLSLVPEWDAYWIANSPIGSSPIGIIGPAEPFKLRVFGSMNSPNSLSTALAMIVMMIVAVRGKWYAVAAAIACAAIFITLQRSVVGGLALGLVLLAFYGSRNARSNIAGMSAFFGATALVALAYLSDDLTRVTERFSLGGSLGSDESFVIRLAQYTDFATWMADAMGGHGFGWRTFGEVVFVLDSGIIDTFMSLGVVGGVAYFAGFVGLMLVTCERGVFFSGFATAAAIAALFNAAQLIFGFPLIGEHGFFTFLAIGLALIAGDHWSEGESHG